MSSLPLTDKPVALIAGARQGICDQIVFLLGQAHQMTVLVGTPDEQYGAEAVTKLTALGIEAGFIRLEISAPASIETAVSLISDKFDNRLDVLINYSDVILASSLARPTVSSIFAATFQANVNYPFLISNAMQPLLQRSRAGRIVNMTTNLRSVDPKVDPNWEASPYRILCHKSSRAALQLKTVLFALRLVEDGTSIKVNTIEVSDAVDGRGALYGASAIEQSASVVVSLATLPASGPSGQFFDTDHPVL